MTTAMVIAEAAYLIDRQLGTDPLAPGNRPPCRSSRSALAPAPKPNPVATQLGGYRTTVAASNRHGV